MLPELARPQSRQQQGLQRQELARPQKLELELAR